jgi:hypothetical protein
MAGTWDEIMAKSPTMKALVEAKIAEEVGKKQAEIDVLRTDLALTQAALDELILGGAL